MHARLDPHWKQEEQVLRQVLLEALKTFALLTVLLSGVLALCVAVLILYN